MTKSEPRRNLSREPHPLRSLVPKAGVAAAEGVVVEVAKVASPREAAWEASSAQPVSQPTSEELFRPAWEELVFPL